MASLKFSTAAAAGDEVDTQVVSEVDTVAGVEAVLGAISAVVADAVAVETSGVGAAVSAALPVEENRHRVDQHFLQNDQHFWGTLIV
jgi:hypothetical protein